MNQEGTALLAVDPGLVHPAAAVFVNGKLTCASRIALPREYSKMPVGQRCLAIARTLVARMEPHACWGWGLDVQTLEFDELVIEWPQIYSTGKSKGDPADILPIVGVGMAVAGLLPDAKVHSPTPAQWIGQLPKSTTGDPLASPRGARIWSRLSDEERAGVKLSHDALDAAGLGLWALGRLERRRVFPGAT